MYCTNISANVFVALLPAFAVYFHCTNKLLHVETLLEQVFELEELYTCNMPAGLDTDFALEPPDTVAIIGEDVILNCTPPPSTPPAVITWTRDFSLLNDPRYQVQQNGSLLIRTVRLNDQSTYYCTATNPLLGTSRLSRGAVVTAIGEQNRFCTWPSLATWHAFREESMQLIQPLALK